MKFQGKVDKRKLKQGQFLIFGNLDSVLKITKREGNKFSTARLTVRELVNKCPFDFIELRWEQ